MLPAARSIVAGPPNGPISSARRRRLAQATVRRGNARARVPVGNPGDDGALAGRELGNGARRLRDDREVRVGYRSPCGSTLETESCIDPLLELFGEHVLESVRFGMHLVERQPSTSTK